MFSTLILAAALAGQSCYGGAFQGSAYADPSPAATQVDEVTTVTTRSYTLPAPSPQAFAAPAPVPACNARAGLPYGGPSCGGTAFRGGNFGAPQPAYGGAMLAGNFGVGVGVGGPSAINARRGVRIKGNSPAALDGLFNNGGGLTINARRVHIKRNR